MYSPDVSGQAFLLAQDFKWELGGEQTRLIPRSLVHRLDRTNKMEKNAKAGAHVGSCCSSPITVALLTGYNAGEMV
jgi:hypothetical protein